MPELPEDVRAFLIELARDGDDLARATRADELLSEHTPAAAHVLGDVVWWVDEALVWDTDPETREMGWWAPKQDAFVAPPPQAELQVLVGGGQLVERDDAETQAKLTAAYDLFNAMEWALARWVLYESTGTGKLRKIVPVGLDTVDALVKTYRAALDEQSVPDPAGP